jgi:hypothetical protein
MTSINVESNNIPAEKIEEIYQMVRMNKLNVALSDKSLTELDLSGIGFGVEGVKAVTQYISDNGKLSSCTFGDEQAMTMTTMMTDANFSGKLKSYEAHIVAAFLTKCM